jgi:2-keto-3-deoxy-6-phosphogluconate aldolase
VIVSDTALVDAVIGAGTILEDATMLVAAAC